MHRSMTAEPDARRYHRVQFWLGAVELGLTGGYLAAVLATDAGPAVDRAARHVSPALAWRVAAVAAVLAAGHGLLTLPLTWLRAYWLPRRHGLLHQSLAGWARDRLKAAGLGGGLGLVVIEIVYGLMAATPWWWAIAAAVLTALQVALAVVFPVWLMPMFYRLTPLADADLRDRLVRLVRAGGVRAVGVWVADQSRKSRTANAALAGLGRTRRIILFDTLVTQFGGDEIEAVLAHELGHHVHHDAWRGLAAHALLTTLGLWLADVVLRANAARLHLDGVADPGGLPWLALVLGALGLASAPLVNAFSRWMERAADDYALGLTRDHGSFVRAMERLATLNLAERRPHRLKEALFYSHPSIDRRVARATALSRGERRSPPR
jgi:STE24 endopeptidase